MSDDFAFEQLDCHRLDPDALPQGRRRPFEVTGHAQRKAWYDGGLPDVEEVAPGLWSIPLPNRFNPIRYVYCYVFVEDGGSLTVVDPGWRDEDSWTALTAGLRRIGFAPSAVRQILLTHIHPDHHGASAALVEHSGARVLMHIAEESSMARPPGDLDAVVEASVPWLRRMGAGAPEIEQFRSDPYYLDDYVSLYPPDRTLTTERRIELPGWHLEPVWAPGHTSGHLCLYLPDQRLLLSGDHLLPRVSSNVMSDGRTHRNPLGEYFRSLRTVAALDVDEVLPAHEWRFTGHIERVAELLAHHDDRMSEMLDALPAQGSDVTSIARRLTWYKPWEQIPEPMRRAALGETLAHLIELGEQGRVVNDGRRTEQDERVWIWSAA